MNNAEEILSALDAKLNKPVELTIYGRAALALGFKKAPPEYFRSNDVDVVLWLHQDAELQQTNFWDAVNELNAEFQERGLYLTHLFTEAQVIITPRWRQQRVQIPRPWQELTVFRLGDADLFLSKLMRDDPQDIADARFIASQSGWNDEEIATIISKARVPDISALREEFAHAAKHFLTLHRQMKTRVLLESAAISAVTYNRDMRTLDVEFRGGGTYRYLDVPRSMYGDLLKAESAGAFWNEVKDQFAYIRLD